MAKLQQGVEITIRAFLPVAKDLDAQHTALTLVKDAKTSGKFDELLGQSLDVEVKTEMRNRRTADAPAAPAGEAGNEQGSTTGETAGENSPGTSAQTSGDGSTSDASTSTTETSTNGTEAEQAAKTGRKSAKAA